MGHLVGKDIYRQLGKKIDGSPMRAPWNDALHAILKELYSPEEAELLVSMPYGLARIDQIARVTRYERGRLEKLLDNLAERGLVLDIWVGNEYHYTISPMVVGIFEFTMMRTRGELNMKQWARLFNDYIQGDDSFYKSNVGKGKKISPLRALPYEETIEDSEHVEILDYEKASAIVDRAKSFAIGICSCRHEKLHTGEKKCDVPLETCSSMGDAAEYMIRHGFGKEVERSEMRDNLVRSKELGLVMCADNVKQDISFICHCCGCCCNVLLGISRFGYPATVVTSTFIIRRDERACSECGDCAEACPINAIMATNGGAPEIDESICLGCGVCALQCDTGALELVKRRQRVLHPEDTFQRVILQSLERGTLQNLLFPLPEKTSHRVLRGVVGGFLKLPPTKMALMSDTLRSRFLNVMASGR